MEFILPAIKFLTYIGIGLIILGILMFFEIIKGRKGKTQRQIGAVICVILGLFLVLQRSSGKIIIEEDRLILKSTFLKSRTIPVEEIQRAWIEDLIDSEWRPIRRKGGTSGSGIKSGTFRLKNGRSAFVVLQGNRSLCIETKDGKLALMGLIDFIDFISKVKTQLPRLAVLLL